MPRRIPHYSRIFISYSHDSPEHMRMVLQLSNRLRADGMDSYIDQYEMSPPEGWARWTIRKVEEADFIIVVCTETYNRRFLGKEDKGKGRGVKWEGAVITQELYEQEARNTKFIPVLFSPLDSPHIPIFLRGATFYDLTSEEGYDELYRRLTNQPRILMTELGKLKPMPPVEGKQVFPISQRISDQEPAGFHSVASDEASAFTVTESNDSLIKRRRTRVGVWSAALLLLTLIVAMALGLIPLASVDKKITAPSANKPEIIPQQKITTPSQVYNVALSWDGEMAASADVNGVVCLWNVTQADRLKELEQVGLFGPTRCVAISPNANAKMVAAGDDEGGIRLWQIGDGHSLRSWKGHTDYVFQVYFSADGQKILSAGVDTGKIKAVRLWNVSDGSLLTKLLMPEPNDIIITVSPDLQIVAVYSSQAKKAQIRSLRDAKRLGDLDGPEFVVRGGAFSRDVQVLALGSEDGTIRLWRVGDGKLLNELKGLNNNVEAIAFHPDGQIIAAGYPDGKIYFWNVNEINPFNVLSAHDGPVNAIAFSTNGQILASASEDKTIRFWRINTSN